MSDKNSLRDRYSHVDLTGRRAVVVGATAGLGRAIAFQLAERNASVTFVGRHKQHGLDAVSHATQLSSSSNSNDNKTVASHRFVRLDASLLTSIHEFCTQLREENNPLDILVLSQGIATTQGRTETPEGIDVKMALHYFGRVALVQGLLPLLLQSDDARVQFILSGGVHSAYGGFRDDFELKRSYSLKAAADSCGFYLDIATESLAGENPGVLFVHSSPGIVATSWGTELNPVLRGVVRVMQKLVAKSPEDAALYLCAPMIGARPKECNGSNWLIMNQYGKRTATTDLHAEAREFVWEQTQRVLSYKK